MVSPTLLLNPFIYLFQVIFFPVNYNKIGFKINIVTTYLKLANDVIELLKKCIDFPTNVTCDLSMTDIVRKSNKFIHLISKFQKVHRVQNRALVTGFVLLTGERSDSNLISTLMSIRVDMHVSLSLFQMKSPCNTNDNIGQKLHQCLEVLYDNRKKMDTTSKDFPMELNCLIENILGP